MNNTIKTIELWKYGNTWRSSEDGSRVWGKFKVYGNNGMIIAIDFETAMPLIGETMRNGEKSDNLID